MPNCYVCGHSWIQHILGMSCHVKGCGCRGYVKPPKYKPPKDPTTKRLPKDNGDDGGGYDY